MMEARYTEHHQRRLRVARVFKVWLLVNLALISMLASGAIAYHLAK